MEGWWEYRVGSQEKQSVCPILIYFEIQSKQLSDLLNILNTLRALCLFQMCKMP